MRLRVCCLILLFMATSIESSEKTKKKVLIYNPFLGYYHTKFMATIANELNAAGYEVTMLDSVVSNVKIAERHEDIIIERVEQNEKAKMIIDNGNKMDQGLKAFWEDVSDDQKLLGLFSYYQRRSNFSTLLTHQCKDLLDSPAFAKIMEKQFDIAITEVFDLCGVGFFHKLKPTRIVLASSVPLHEYFGEKLGLPKSFDIVPTKFSMSTPSNLRVEFEGSNIAENAVQSSLFGNEMFGYLEKYQTEIFTQKYGSFPEFKVLLRNAHSLIENVHPLLDLNKPTLNAIIPIGGITYNTRPINHLINKELATKKKVYDDIAAAKDANKKIVVVSFGTVMNPSTMKRETMDNLLEAFEKVDNAHFFWKANLDVSMLDKLPKNVQSYDWLPQTELLNSGKIDLFLSHMGIGSMTEAAYSGVPLVSIPIFVDQHYNYMCAVRLGIARFVDKASLAKTSKELREALSDALMDEEMSATSIQLKKNLDSFGDQRKKMIDHINFILTLPVDSPSKAFETYHEGVGVSSSLQSLLHLIPLNLAKITLCLFCLCSVGLLPWRATEIVARHAWLLLTLVRLLVGWFCLLGLIAAFIMYFAFPNLLNHIPHFLLSVVHLYPISLLLLRGTFVALILIAFVLEIKCENFVEKADSMSFYLSHLAIVISLTVCAIVNYVYRTEMPTFYPMEAWGGPITTGQA